MNRAKVGAGNRLHRKRERRRLIRQNLLFTSSELRYHATDALVTSLAKSGFSFKLPFIDKKKRDDLTVTVEDFDLINNSEHSLKVLSAIAYFIKKRKKFYVDFLDEYCLDIGPYVLFGLLYRQADNRLCLGGHMHHRVAKVLRAVGFGKEFNMLFESGSEDGVWPFPIEFHGRRRRFTASEVKHDSRQIKVSKRFAASVNGWLSEVGFGLTPDGNDRLTAILLEVLDNSRHAERNNDLDGQWAICGFMAQRNSPEKGSYFLCHFVIVTVGASISATLADAQSMEVRELVDAYTSRHSAALGSRSLDALRIVTSLANGITCVKETDERGGGCGMSYLVSVIRSLASNNFGAENCSSAVISGSGCVRLVEPYNYIHMEDEGSAFQLFNSEQDSAIPPSTDHVHATGTNFPGTIITSKFVIDRDDLVAKHANSENGGE